MSKKKIRIAADITMTVLLPLLMAYSLIGEMFHEIAGVAMLLLFAAHHILNRKWYSALSKGKYSAWRIYQTVLIILLIIIMVLQPLSGIFMSKHLFTFIKIPGISASARTIHLALAYWGFVLMCIHAGGHLAGPVKRLNKQNRTAAITILIICAAVSVYGIIAFVKRQMPEYMFLKTAFVFFDFSEPVIRFILDYLAVMVLFAAVGCLITSLLSAADRKRG